MLHAVMRSVGATNLPRGWVIALVAGMAALHFALATTSTLQKSMTHDEIVHLTGGVSYWMFDDYRLHPENGNLPQRWAALPVVELDAPEFPSQRQAPWQSSRAMPLGDQLCHDLDNDLGAMLLHGRMSIALLSVGACLLAFFWSKSLFGIAGALLTMALAALSPTLLAHGRLITSDICTALFLGASTWGIWCSLQRVTVSRVLASSLAVGALFISKMSAPLILPIAAAMVAVRMFSRQPVTLALWGLQPRQLEGRGAQLLAIAGMSAVHISVTIAVIWAAFGFRYSAFGANDSPPPRFSHYESVAEVSAESGLSGQVLTWCAENELLPQAYLYGMGLVLAEQERLAFLNGNYSNSGFSLYFPFCLITKTPLPLFGLLAAFAIALFRSRNDQRSRWFATTPIWALLGIYWAAAISTPLNIGHRHILPTYVPMFVLAGGAAPWIIASKRGRLIIAALLALFAFESARAYPHYLSYFNWFIDRDRAHEHLVASNLDWGQDLPGLATWLEENNTDQRPAFLAYFGTGYPDYYGIDAGYVPVSNWLPLDRRRMSKDHFMAPMRAGYYCVSATALHAVHTPFPGKWTEFHERAYQISRTWKRNLNLNDSGAKPAKMVPTVKQATNFLDALQSMPVHNKNHERAVETAEVWKNTVLGNANPQGQPITPNPRHIRHAADRLRAARLMAFLRQREPIDNVGHSILIYELSDEEARAAIEGPAPDDR